MSHDLGRALGDLADAAARSASRGIVAEPAVGPTLERLVTRVRRRRAARVVGTGALALVLVGVTAGAVDAGLTHRTNLPPVETPAVTAPPTPTSEPTTAPSGTSVIDPAGMQCGGALQQLGGSDVPEAPAWVSAPPAPTTPTDRAPAWTVTVHNLSATTMSLIDTAPTLVLTRADGAGVVGGGAFDTGDRGPAEAGQSTDYRMTKPPTACASDGASVLDGVAPLEPGDYRAWVVVTATPLGATEPVQVAGFWFPLTFVDPADAQPLTSADDLFACGAPLPFDESTVPMPAGLWLAPDHPEQGWTTTSTPDWHAKLTVTDARRVDLTARGDVQLAFVGQDGLVKARTFTDALGMQDVTVAGDEPATLQGTTTVSACLPNGQIGGMAQSAPLAPGTYTVWAYLPVTINHVDPEGDVPYEPDAVVVQVPPASTVTLAG